MSRSSGNFSERVLPGAASVAFAAVIACFFLVFFNVRIGDAEPRAIKGIDLVTGIGQATASAAPLVVIPEENAADTVSADLGPTDESPAQKARRFLDRKEHAEPHAPAPPPSSSRPTPDRTRAPMAIALAACALLGLVTSLIPLRVSRFAAAAFAIIGLICAAMLMTGAKDLPFAQTSAGTGVVTGALEVMPGYGFWAAIGCLSLATVLAALGLRPEPARTEATHAKPTAVAAAPPMRTYSSSEKSQQKPRASDPGPQPPPSVPVRTEDPPSEPEKPAVIMVPEEPPKGPEAPPPATTPPSSGGWTFKKPDPAPAVPPEQPPAPPSSWSFAGGETPTPPSQAPTPAPAPPQEKPASWSFGGSERPASPSQPVPATPQAPPATPPPAPPEPAASSWTFGTSGSQPPTPPQQRPPQTPPPTPPPPTSHYAPPPPPPNDRDDPMEPQGPSYPPPPPSAGMGVFTSFAAPYFNMIDSGVMYRRPFVILYIILAFLNLLSILGVLAVMFKGGVAGILIGLFAIFGLWIGFQLWWNRREKINSFVSAGSEFVALPVFSHFFQTAGEWFGTMMAIVGTGSSLVAALFGSSDGGFSNNPMDMFMMMSGSTPVVGIIASPLAGFLILIVTRAVAEQIRALVAVANNTRSIEINTRK